MYCEKCGMEIHNSEGICLNCEGGKKVKNGVKFLPSFILGLIGSLFGISGGLCVTMCTSIFSSSYGLSALVLILGGSIVGLIGACKCLTNAKLGSLIEIVAAIMIIICAYGITGSDMSTVVAIIMFLTGGIVGLLYSIAKEKNETIH